MAQDTIGKTLAVAVGVCVVCSVFVSTAAVMLKGQQELNKTLDKKKNVLLAAGLLKEDEPADEKKVGKLFEQIDSQWIELETGELVDRSAIPEESLDERKAAKDPQFSQAIEQDIAGIRRTPTYREVFLVKKDGNLDRVILPVHGKGLWSTMYGFLALGPDLNTIRRLAFYEHGETPGLGGEVDNPTWKQSWVDKKAFDEAGNPKIKVVKGKADPDSPYEADGLSGATLTARGVDYLVQFWLGPDGYGPFLDKLEKGTADG